MDTKIRELRDYYFRHIEHDKCDEIICNDAAVLLKRFNDAVAAAEQQRKEQEDSWIPKASK